MKPAAAGAVLLALLLVPLAADAGPRDAPDPAAVRQTNEYASYVHFQPEWNSYPRNLIVDVTASWDRQPGQGGEPDISKHGARDRQNGLQHINGRPVVSVQFDYMDCQSQWFHYAKTGLDLLGRGLGLFGQEGSVKNAAYTDAEQEQKLKRGFAQFVPICTSKESTAYDYTVTINDGSLGFDAYFVPSESELRDYFLHPDGFEHHEGCAAHNYQRLEGSCAGLGASSGLLIAIPDELSRPMTKITVDLSESAG